MGDIKLVFYDLEWSQSEIIQIGAVCETADFSQCIRPTGKIDPFVRKKIKLDVRKDHTGQWQVFDIVRKRFLPTVSPREGFERFLSWLEEVSEGCTVFMVSHGNADILVLDRNLARFGLDRRLYKVVTKYLDFQKYLSEHFKDISHLSLSQLVNIFCNDQIFRLHCADEDSKALMSVFSNMHGMRGVEPADFMKKMEKMKKVYLKSVIIPKNSKEIKEIANHLNPGSKYVLLPSIFGVYNIFVSSPLFKIIEQPENFKFEVSGYCVSHGKEKYQPRHFSVKSEEEMKERTRIELACHIGNAYFMQTKFIDANAKSQFNLVRKEGKRQIQLVAGTPLSVMILVTSTNFVKVDDVSINEEKRSVDIKKIIADLHKKNQGQKPLRSEGLTSHRETESPARPPSFHSTGSSRRGSRPESQEAEIETDSSILNRRGKQLDYCKRTEDYKAYVGEIPKTKREPHMPRTPNMTGKYSRRQWDGAVKKWKTEVHAAGREIIRRQQGRLGAECNGSEP